MNALYIDEHSGDHNVACFSLPLEPVEMDTIVQRYDIHAADLKALLKGDIRFYTNDYHIFHISDRPLEIKDHAGTV